MTNNGATVEETAIASAEHDCWLCEKPGATMPTKPQPPDNTEWWFHPPCYWELQALLN